MITVKELKDRLYRSAGYIDWTSSYELDAEHNGYYRRVMDIYSYNGTDYVPAKCEVRYRDADIGELYCDARSFEIVKVME